MPTISTGSIVLFNDKVFKAKMSGVVVNLINEADKNEVLKFPKNKKSLNLSHISTLPSGVNNFRLLSL